MNEKGKEFVAKKKWDKKQVVLFWGVIVFMLAAFAVLSILNIAFMVAFLFVLGVLSLYYMKNIFKAEYAYTVSSKLTVEILKSGGKRVEICQFFLSDMTFCGVYNDENGQKLEDVDNIITACTDARDEEETYCALFDRDGKKTAVLFTPNDMMLDELRKAVKCNIE